MNEKSSSRISATRQTYYTHRLRSGKEGEKGRETLSGMCGYVYPPPGQRYAHLESREGEKGRKERKKKLEKARVAATLHGWKCTRLDA